MIKLTSPSNDCPAFIAFRGLFALCLLPIAGLRLALACLRAGQRLRYALTDVGLAYSADADLRGDALPTVAVHAVCLEPLYARRGNRYQPTTDLRQPVYRKVNVGKRTQYIAVVIPTAV
jgi:hypothetical protein